MTAWMVTAGKLLKACLGYLIAPVKLQREMDAHRRETAREFELVYAEIKSMKIAEREGRQHMHRRIEEIDAASQRRMAELRADVTARLGAINATVSDGFASVNSNLIMMAMKMGHHVESGPKGDSVDRENGNA